MKSSYRTALGIDIGTTSISVTVVDLDKGGNLFTDSIVHNAVLPPDIAGANLQDPMILLQISRKLIERALLHCPHIGAMGITGQMHGIIPIDHQGIPTGPAYTWLDSRGKHVEHVMMRKIGRIVPVGYGAATLCALHQAGALHPHTERAVSIPSWIAGQLTGGSSFAASAGLSHSLGLFSLDTLEFQSDLWNAVCPLPPPSVGKDATFIGETTTGIPVCLPEGDNQTSFLATVRDPLNAVSFNIGTSGQVTLISPDAASTDNLLRMEARPFPGGKKILVGASLSGGKSFELLTKLVSEIVDLVHSPVRDPFSLLADLKRPKDIPAVQSTFSGTRLDPEIRGIISSIGFDNFSLAHLYWGMANGVINELFEMVQPYLSVLDSRDSYVTASGNALKQSRPLQVMLSEYTKLPLMWPTEVEAAARGAAMLAGAALYGGVSFLPELQLRTIHYCSSPNNVRD